MLKILYTSPSLHFNSLLQQGIVYMLFHSFSHSISITYSPFLQSLYNTQLLTIYIMIYYSKLLGFILTITALEGGSRLCTFIHNCSLVGPALLPLCHRLSSRGDGFLIPWCLLSSLFLPSIIYVLLQF